MLALRGANVIIPSRTLESGLKVKESLAEQVPSSKLHVMEMDLSSLSSVRDFARSFDSSHEHLNLLMYVSAAISETLQIHIQNSACRCRTRSHGNLKHVPLKKQCRDYGLPLPAVQGWN